MALALGFTLYDFTLVRSAIKTGIVGVLIGFGLAVIIGVIIGVEPDVPAIAARTDMGLSDVALDLAAGAAGALAFTTGVSGALIGVMVAVALMPPLVVAGMMTGSGHMGLALGACLLFATNIVCVNLAGIATFLLQGVRPRLWWQAELARAATRKAAMIWGGLLVILLILLSVA